MAAWIFMILVGVAYIMLFWQWLVSYVNIDDDCRFTAQQTDDNTEKLKVALAFNRIDLVADDIFAQEIFTQDIIAQDFGVSSVNFRIWDFFYYFIENEVLVILIVLGVWLQGCESIEHELCTSCDNTLSLVQEQATTQTLSSFVKRNHALYTCTCISKGITINQVESSSVLILEPGLPLHSIYFVTFVENLKKNSPKLMSQIIS